VSEDSEPEWFMEWLRVDFSILHEELKKRLSALESKQTYVMCKHNHPVIEMKIKALEEFMNTHTHQKLVKDTQFLEKKYKQLEEKLGKEGAFEKGVRNLEERSFKPPYIVAKEQESPPEVDNCLDYWIKVFDGKYKGLIDEVLGDLESLPHWETKKHGKCVDWQYIDIFIRKWKEKKEGKQ
jgi:hypothetical protein